MSRAVSEIAMLGRMKVFSTLISCKCEQWKIQQNPCIISGQYYVSHDSVGNSVKKINELSVEFFVENDVSCRKRGKVELECSYAKFKNECSLTISSIQHVKIPLQNFPLFTPVDFSIFFNISLIPHHNQQCYYDFPYCHENLFKTWHILWAFSAHTNHPHPNSIENQENSLLEVVKTFLSQVSVSFD